MIKKNSLLVYPINSSYRPAGKPLRRITLRGFTLVEMLVVTVTLAIVSLAIYATFNNGIKVWQKINQRMPEEDMDLFFDKFTLDLRNTFKFGKLNFSGDENRVRFAALVNSLRMKKKTIGEVSYFYDRASGTLNREEKDYSRAYTNDEGTIRSLMTNIKELKFQYYLYDSEKKEYLWQDEWRQEGLPVAVKVELELDNGKQSNKFIKTVSIPVSG